MEQFRFLDLPKELRLMVYERLSIVTRHVKYHYGVPFTAVAKVIPTSILATCRLINLEATPTIRGLLERTSAPPRIIIDVSSIYADPTLWAGGTVVDLRPSQPQDWFNRACFRVEYQSLNERFPITDHRHVEVGFTCSQGLEDRMAACYLEGLVQALWMFAEAFKDDSTNKYMLRSVSHLLPEPTASEEDEQAAVCRALRSTLAYTVVFVGPKDMLGMSSLPNVWSQGTSIQEEEWAEEWAWMH